MPERLLALILLAALLGACAALPSRSGPGASLPTAQVSVATLPASIVPATRPPLSPTSAPAPTASPTAAPTLVASASPAPGGDGAVREAQLVAQINEVRAAHGLPPYRLNPELSAAARAHSCDLATHGVISHSSSDGRTLATRLAGRGAAWQWPSENIAAGTDDPAAVVAMWMDEPPDGWHRRNILDPDQRDVGAGYCQAPDDPAGNYHYWTADFSRAADQ